MNRPFRSLTFVKANGPPHRDVRSRPLVGRRRVTPMHKAANRLGLRDLFVRLAVLLPLIQVLAPAAAAFNAAEDGWCRSVASQTSRDGRPVHNPNDGQCLVCIAQAIGSSSAPASPPVYAAPRALVAGLLTPQSAAVLRGPDLAAGSPIRAPPQCQPQDRIPAAFHKGTALA